VAAPPNGVNYNIINYNSNNLGIFCDMTTKYKDFTFSGFHEVLICYMNCYYCGDITYLESNKIKDTGKAASQHMKTGGLSQKEVGTQVPINIKLLETIC